MCVRLICTAKFVTYHTCQNNLVVLLVDFNGFFWFYGGWVDMLVYIMVKYVQPIV